MGNYLKMLSKTDKLPVHTDLETLDIYCEYLLNDSSKYINFANLTNLQEYISRMDPKLLMSNDAKMARYEFIRLYLEARIIRGVVSRKMCLRYVSESVDHKYWKIIQRDILNSIEADTLKKKDIEFINDMIFAQLNVMFLHGYRNSLVSLLEDLETNEFGKHPEDCPNAIQMFQTILNELMKAQRRSKQDNRFNLTDATHFNAVMTEAWNRLLSESQYWKTGMKGMNSMLGGGFENGRVYNFIGATGGFKSGLLLNLMKMIKLNNKGHQHKDMNKRPTVLFLSQENNIWETILRIFGIFGTTMNIRNFKPEQIMEILKKGGFCLVQDELDIDIEFRYYGNMDIGANDIRGIVEELDNEGREVICILQDYIERLRPPMLNVDRRTQLNDCSNQLHDLAIDLDIPIITGSQFNRDGVAIIEDMRSSDKHDIAMKVGSKNVSESFGMLKNFDVNICIIIEYDSDDQRFWLSFRRLKFRGDDTGALEYFLQPFVGKNSKIQLMQDINLDTPVYRLSMVDEMAANVTNSADEINELRRKTHTILDPEDSSIMFPVTDDPDEQAINEFRYQIAYDLSRTKGERPDGIIRDSEGFCVLVRKRPPKDDTNELVASLPGRAFASA